MQDFTKVSEFFIKKIYEKHIEKFEKLAIKTEF